VAGLVASAPAISGLGWTEYFDFYTKSFIAMLVDGGQHLCLRSHEDLCQMAQLLATESIKERIREKIRRRFTPGRFFEAEDTMVNGTISLATRFVAMISIGRLENETSLDQPIIWEDGPVNKAIHTHFINYTNAQLAISIAGQISALNGRITWLAIFA
jgi:hypothetical protein